MTTYICCEEQRREAVKASDEFNGIDFLEVVDTEAATPDERQRTLRVHFLKAPAPTGISKDKVRITGGERITTIRVDQVSYDGDVLLVHVTAPGDFSTYTLHLTEPGRAGFPLAGLDPLLSSVDFSFKVECPSEFDCRTGRICPPASYPQPEIQYLAKDYASFRQLMLDRLAILAPTWRERHVADLGMTLVELLAYVGDYLSYQQDAVATEAYLGTARRRVSVRRHARLVDYFMHEGCNARVWVAVQAGEGVSGVVIPGPTEDQPGTVLLTKGEAPRGPLREDRPAAAVNAGSVVFETMHDLKLFAAHNEMHFYTWGDQRCCLPRGATRATLNGHFPNLSAGDVLIFEEVLGPRTGEPEEADPSHRHALRLTKVDPFEPTEPSKPLTDPLTAEPITEIEWAVEDALPFPFCVSTRTDKEHGEHYKEDVSVARGNIVLADHGRTISNEFLGDPELGDKVPKPTLFRVLPPAGDRCEEVQPNAIFPRFHPRLRHAPLTYAAPYDREKAPAARAAMQTAPADALPGILLSSGNGEIWQPRWDLLESHRDDLHFVVETESDGTASLRFGDGECGQRPEEGTQFAAQYRIGNGEAGNVGAEAIAHIVSQESAITSVRNPLPAQGGAEPESIEQVRRNAPDAFRTQQRAVTREDYAEMAERHPEVQRAAATFRWTGSWRTVFMTVDRFGGLPVDDDFKAALRTHLEQYRLAGYDLEIDAPRFVSLEIEMTVCVKRDYFRSYVNETLLERLSNRVLDGGRLGVFHPDNFTFGQPVYLSRLYAAVQACEGVQSVRITTFQRQGQPGSDALEKGKLALGRLEIARLDNAPNFPERGVLRLTMSGGK